MDVGTSKGLESFLAFLREATERHRMAEADRTVIKGLERLLGDVRKQERRSEGRSYAPRTHILEDIRRDGEKEGQHEQL